MAHRKSNVIRNTAGEGSQSARRTPDVQAPHAVVAREAVELERARGRKLLLAPIDARDVRHDVPVVALHGIGRCAAAAHAGNSMMSATRRSLIGSRFRRDTSLSGESSSGKKLRLFTVRGCVLNNCSIEVNIGEQLRAPRVDLGLQAGVAAQSARRCVTSHAETHVRFVEEHHKYVSGHSARRASASGGRT